MQFDEQGAAPQSDQQPDASSSEWFNDDAVTLMKVNDELASARNSAIDLLAEIEDILLQQNPRIEAEWQVIVGVWENRLLEAQISARRAKRKSSLIQARVNSGEDIDIQRIETQLDNEFEEWRQQLETATANYQQAVETQVTAVQMSAIETDALKKAFRTIAKRLHPDLHPELGESARHMFTLAELAYRKGDVKILQSLEVSTRGLEEEPGFCATLVEAQAELTLMQAQIRQLEERMGQIKSEKPYSLLALLNDEEWVSERISQIKSEIEACKRSEQGYRSRCEELMEHNG
ncbi:MAG: hypothetical protein J5804_03705 [Eggerthellaceae bacterium]|nr:hypothetical protein [Eggerthellaceae bacterium]